MPNNFNNRSLAVSQRIYGHLLRAYPQAHREEYGPAMAQLFRDQSRDAWKESRGWGMAKLWLRVLPDLVNTSIVERLSALNPRKTMTDKISAVTRPATSPLAVFITVFAIVFSLVLTSSIIITFILPDSYASTARIKVQQAAELRHDVSAYDPYFIQTEFEVIQSQIVLDPVIAKLNLDVQWGKKYLNGETLKTTESIALLKNRLNLDTVRGTKLVAITVYSEDRNEAALIANTIAESYRDYRIAKAGKSDPQIPTASLVQIVDKAEPGLRPVRPNKPLNIFIGAVVGGFLGLIAGGGAALVTSKLGKRGIHVVSA